MKRDVSTEWQSLAVSIPEPKAGYVILWAFEKLPVDVSSDTQLMLWNGATHWKCVADDTGLEKITLNRCSVCYAPLQAVRPDVWQCIHCEKAGN